MRCAINEHSCECVSSYATSDSATSVHQRMVRALMLGGHVDEMTHEVSASLFVVG